MRRLFVFILAVGLCSAIAAPAQAALRAPTLTGPANEAGVEALPTFYWNKVKNAASYDFQLSASSKFTSVVNGTGTDRGSYRTRNTAATLDRTIPDGAYYWRVRAVSARDTAGKWSPVRSFTKGWTTAPVLQDPADDLSVSWPALPLVLRWSVVPHAVKYHVTVATDPALASPVVGSVTRPLETSGTNYALQGSLAEGRYYWAVTPVDAQGHKGTRSRVGSFVWRWPTGTGPTFTDLNPDPRVVDPEFSWNPVPGAAKYHVEVNPDSSFAPDAEVLDVVTSGTSHSPRVTLHDNTYHWRVRAIDANGNGGVWNVGPDFVKNFDKEPGLPSIRRLRVRDNLDLDGDTSIATATNRPVVVWDPVPGASAYEVQGFKNCDSSQKVWDDFTSTPAWTPLSQPSLPNVGPASWGSPTTDSDPNIFPATGEANYCVRVRAYTDRPGSSLNGYISLPTEVNLTVSPLPAAGSTTPAAPVDATYLHPKNVGTPRMPVFTWQAVPNASHYIVVVASDPDFIHVIDHVATRVPAYAPRKATAPIWYAEETTRFYWTIVPYNAGSTPRVPPGAPDVTNHAPFDKQSVPPTLLAPTGGQALTTRPRFRWTSAEAARRYRLEVASDESFSNLIERVDTSSTSYTSSADYPADTALYWRVGAMDETLEPPRTWSARGEFRRGYTPPSPAGGNPGGGSDIPVLSWTPVEGAVSYGLHVDQSDGTAKDFTLESTSFTPTQFYGTGIWRWRVRANFPAKTGSVSSGYFAPQQYVRTIPAPTGARAVKTGSRLLIYWDPARIAKRYKAEISSTSGFGNRVVATDTDNTAWAPDLISQGFKDGGTLYWRVANVDDGNNVGAWTTGSFVLPKRIAVTVNGRLRRGVRRPVVIKLQDAKGRAISKASVSATGAGMRRVHKRTGKKGTVRMFLRPRRGGTVVIRATRRGYAPATVRLKAF